MLGGAVCHQRLGGGYIQVVLGCIPDLQTDMFTFDTIPLEAEIHRKESPPPVACMASLDTRLSLQYERVLSSHLNTLKQRLGDGCPLVGGVYPAVEGADKSEERPGDSVFFVNDRVYKGSAAAVILRSRLLKAHAVSCVPSIRLDTVTIDELNTSDENVVVINKINGKTAFDVIHGMYAAEDIKDKPCRLYFGISHENACVPVSFTGDPAKRVLQLVLPPGVELEKGASVDILVDDVELDTEVAAGLIIGMEKKLSPVCTEKDITVAREARRSIVASSTMGLHFSYPGLNAVVRPDVPMISLGSGNTFFAPSIMQRCVGRSCPNSGFFCAGQVATAGGITGIFTRSSTYCFLQGVS